MPGSTAGLRGECAGEVAALGLAVAHLFPGGGFSPCMGDGGQPSSQKKGQSTGGIPKVGFWGVFGKPSV